MTPFFQSDERRKFLRLAAGGWLGTPFRKWQRVKRAGVDCVQLAAALYIECGVLTEFDPGPYTMDGGEHETESKVLAWLRTSPAFAEHQPHARKIGDLLCFRMNKSPHHVGVLLWDSGTFVHCARFIGGVRFNSLRDDTWSGRLSHVFRPLEVQP